MPIERAVIISKNQPLCRKAAATLKLVGLDSQTIADSADLKKALRKGECLVLVDESELGAVVTRMSDRTKVIALASSDPMSVLEAARHVKGLLGFAGVLPNGAGVRNWELLQLAHRVRNERLISARASLSWGHCWEQHEISSSTDRDAHFESVKAFCSGLQSPRQAAATAQVADELIMNAVYDAPVDSGGRPRHAHDRTKRVELRPNERPVFGFGSDGARIVISVTDPFGRLPRNAVFEGIHRGLATGEMDTKGGGAGLGMLLLYRTAKITFFDVIPGMRTQVTAVVDLTLSAEDSKKTPGSIHFFKHPKPS